MSLLKILDEENLAVKNISIIGIVFLYVKSILCLYICTTITYETYLDMQKTLQQINTKFTQKTEFKFFRLLEYITFNEKRIVVATGALVSFIHPFIYCGDFLILDGISQHYPHCILVVFQYITELFYWNSCGIMLMYLFSKYHIIFS